MRILLIPAFLLMTGCAAHRPVSQNWLLLQQEDARVLMPPGVAPAKAGFLLDVAAGRGKCPPEIHPKGRRVIVTLDAASLKKHPDGWLTAWSNQLESQGCIGHGQAARFAESLPLDPTVGFHLRHFDDIEPPAKLQVVSPILRGEARPEEPAEVTGSGNSLTVTVKAPANQIGYETALYTVQPKSQGAGFTIAPLYADRHVGQEVERATQPDTNFLRFPADAAFYRLIFKSDQTDFTALVVASPTRDGLQRDVTSCAPGDSMCIAIPRLVAINQVVPVTVNGAEIMVVFGANVAEAMRNAGQFRPESVLDKLSVSKMYRGRLTPVEFDRHTQGILGLVLTGGEIISW